MDRQEITRRGAAFFDDSVEVFTALRKAIELETTDGTPALREPTDGIA